MSADTVAVILSPALAENALQLLEEREYAKLAMLADEIADVQGRAEQLLAEPIGTALGAHSLNDLLGRGAKAGKELEVLRKARVEPLNREVKNVNALFGAITTGLDELRAKGERHIIAWNRREKARVEREQAEARRRQEEAARAEGEAMARAEAARSEVERQEALAAAEWAQQQGTSAEWQAPAPAPRAYRSTEATSFTTERWVFEVVAPDEVPRAYCAPDVKAIKAAVAAGVREIPGISIYQQEGLTVRTR